MGRSSRRNDKHEKTGEDDRAAGTAARTRPCSFDEIMSRRKNKMLDGSEKEKGGLEHVSGDVVAGHNAIEKGNNGYDIDSSFNGEKSLREDVKASSRKEEGTVSCIVVKDEKDEEVGKGRERSARDTRTKLKSVISRDVGNEAVDRSNEKVRERRKSDVEKKNYSEIELGRKHSRDVFESDKDQRFNGVRGKYDRENKRKYRTEVDEKNRESSSTKKHDVRKGHELETSAGRGRKESSKYHYKESSLKRRRSRSRGRDDLHKRFGSVSPGAHKHDHIHGRGLEHSLKERLGRQHSDIDRSNTTDSGSNTHHRKPGAPTSRLGGYSPRKRKSEAAIKTPSPTKRSPEKKSARWDLAPERKDNAISASGLSNLQVSNQNAVSRIPELVAAVSDASVTLKHLSGVSPTVLNKNSSIETVQLTEATRPLRRLYVENIPASASEKTLIEFLSKLLISSGVNHIQGAQRCISCLIHKEKGQALVEFLTPEDATAAMSFDGIFFSGSVIKIRRPKDFIEKATVEPEKSVPTVDIISSVVEDSAHKIFIGGISKVLSSQMLMEIARTFGRLKAYQFDNSKSLTNPCAYLEYADQTVTLKACAGLNGMKLGGQVITAVLAVPDASDLESNGDPQLSRVPEHAKPLLEKPSHVLKLKNMFNPEAVPWLSDAETELVLEDVRLECIRFGTIKSVNVVKCIASPLPTPGACEVNDDPGSAHAQQASEHEEPIANSETCREAIDHETLSSNITGENKPEDDLMKDEPCREPGQTDSDAGVQEAAYESPSDGREIHHSNDMVGENSKAEEMINPSDGVVTENCQAKEIIDQTDDVVIYNSQLKETMNVENKSTTREESDLVAAASEEVKEDDNSLGMGSDSKEEIGDPGYIFEAGSVFVEFARTEASCAAAHCLNGRLFDDRAVAVEYVPLEIYRQKFPK